MKSTTFENLLLLLTVSEIVSVLRIGHNVAYQLVKEGNIQNIYAGHAHSYDFFGKIY